MGAVDRSIASLKSREIFVSYSRKDSVTAQFIGSYLNSASYKVWIDLKRIEVGSIWESELLEALRNSFALLVLISPDSITSQWVQREIEMAKQLKIPIIPLIVREVSAEQSLIPHIQAISLIKDLFSGLKQVELALDRLLNRMPETVELRLAVWGLVAAGKTTYITGLYRGFEENPRWRIVPNDKYTAKWVEYGLYSIEVEHQWLPATTLGATNYATRIRPKPKTRDPQKSSNSLANLLGLDDEELSIDVNLSNSEPKEVTLPSSSVSSRWGENSLEINEEESNIISFKLQRSDDVSGYPQNIIIRMLDLAGEDWRNFNEATVNYFTSCDAALFLIDPKMRVSQSNSIPMANVYRNILRQHFFSMSTKGFNFSDGFPLAFCFTKCDQEPYWALRNEPETIITTLLGEDFNPFVRQYSLTHKTFAVSLVGERPEYNEYGVPNPKLQLFGVTEPVEWLIDTLIHR